MVPCLLCIVQRIKKLTNRIIGVRTYALTDENIYDSFQIQGITNLGFQSKKLKSCFWAIFTNLAMGKIFITH